MKVAASFKSSPPRYIRLLGLVITNTRMSRKGPEFSTGHHQQLEMCFLVSNRHNGPAFTPIQECIILRYTR
jgi:hypothetical protein